MNTNNNWKDYECIKTGNGEKLERWNNIILIRPDPQIIWNKTENGIIMMPIIIEVLKAEVTGNLKRNYLNTGLLIIKI